MLIRDGGGAASPYGSQREAMAYLATAVGDAILHSAQFWEDQAKEAETLRAELAERLASLTADGGWTGPGAETFRATVTQDLVDNLEQHATFAKAASARYGVVAATLVISQVQVGFNDIPWDVDTTWHAKQKDEGFFDSVADAVTGSDESPVQVLRGDGSVAAEVPLETWKAMFESAPTTVDPIYHRSETDVSGSQVRFDNVMERLGLNSSEKANTVSAVNTYDSAVGNFKPEPAKPMTFSTTRQAAPVSLPDGGDTPSGGGGGGGGADAPTGGGGRDDDGNGGGTVGIGGGHPQHPTVPTTPTPNPTLPTGPGTTPPLDPTAPPVAGGPVEAPPIGDGGTGAAGVGTIGAPTVGVPSVGAPTVGATPPAGSGGLMPAPIAGGGPGAGRGISFSVGAGGRATVNPGVHGPTPGATKGSVLPGNARGGAGIGAGNGSGRGPGSGGGAGRGTGAGGGLGTGRGGRGASGTALGGIGAKRGERAEDEDEAVFDEVWLEEDRDVWGGESQAPDGQVS